MREFANKESSLESQPLGKTKRTIRSQDLFGCEREVLILHGEAEYRLQITKAGKLILNK